MAEISLRGYIQDIDELIEREKLDEAIAHCRHILQTYPKHLDTYRLLGKAYLEAKRYGDAADIFQRVLSAVPDDFVSHIGMAIVREDEGNLDAAIWHMERAFETNPANPAIQQELRRLIGRRDGLEPHKVRLTRGALARMYAHGELFQQAITELRSALQEDPERPDLQVLLADMYWRTGQQNEAVAVSSRVLEKLPNCLEANRVLAASLRGKDRVEEAAVYHRRIASLDPYASFVESPEIDTQHVEPSAVTLARLEWKPGQPIPSVRAEQPGWAATLGMELQERRAEEAGRLAARPGTGPLPSWLEPGEPPPFLAGSEVEPEAAAEQAEDWEQTPAEGALWREPESFEAPAAEPAAEEVPAERPPVDGIPSWMREAGWGEATGEAVERPISFSDEELGALDQGQLPAAEDARTEEALRELTPAQIPDWIRDIAPPQEELAAEPVLPEPAQPPSWLRQAEASAEDGGLQEDFAQLMEQAEPRAAWPEQVPASDREIPEWGAELPAPAPAAEAEPEPTAKLPDTGEWPTWIADEPPGATDTIVTWLDSRGRRPARKAEPEVPEWMADVPLPTEQPRRPTAAENLQASKEVTPPRGVDRRTPEAPQAPAEEPGAPGWLAAVAEAAAREEQKPEPELPQPAAEYVSEPGAAEELPPDWITQLASMEEEPAQEAPLAEAAGWMPEPLTPEPETAAPDWAVEAGPEREAALEELAAPPAPRGDVPEWLQGLAESVRGAEPAAAPEWPETGDELLPASGPQLSPEETPTWLKGLALEGPPASPAAEAPDWLRSLGEPGSEAEEAAPAEVPDWLRPSEEAAPEVITSRTPDWLRGLAEGTPAMAEPEQPTSESAEAGWRTPDWLEAAQAEMEPEQPAQAAFEALEERPVEAAAEPTPAGEMDDDQVMGWLEQLAAKQAEPAAEEPAEDTGRWLEITFGESAAEPLLEERRLPEEPDEGLEWLERLAEQRGLDVDIGMRAPEAAEPPPAEPKPVRPEPARPQPAEAPEWLQRMAAAPTIPMPRPEYLESPADETLPSGSALRDRMPAPAAGPPVPPAEQARATPPPIEQPPEPVPPPAQPVPEEPEEEVPEWLASFAADWTPAPRAIRPEEPITTYPGPVPPVAQPTPPPPQPVAPPAPPAAIPSAPVAPPPIQPAPPPAPAAAPPTYPQAAPPTYPPTATPQPPTIPPATPPAPPQPAAAPYAAMPVPSQPEPAPPGVTPTPPPPEAPAPRPARPARRGIDEAQLLDLARRALAGGDYSAAAKSYGQLIKGRRSLEAVITDLQIALDRSPENATLWQSLGDAYMKADQVSEAIDAYRRGMEAA
jgi:tetratricopeptide (TPR) repeat protein